MLSVSILGIKENFDSNIAKLDKLGVDYFHIDIMDGKFVNNTTWQYSDLKDVLTVDTPIDVHLMVYDLDSYIDDFINLNPSIITFHYEATDDYLRIIEKIRKCGIKVGLAIKPDTDVSEILDLLGFVDLVLVMSVEPGFGGQKFIDNSTNKINELYSLREKNRYSFLIEVDGGINDTTIDKVRDADIKVVGSFITNGDYEEQIKKITV